MATKKRGVEPAGAGEATVTILHVSDLQFGIQHRFGRLGLGGADEPFDTLLKRLTDDLDGLRAEEGLEPDLVALTGDLAEWGKPKEYDDATLAQKVQTEIFRDADAPKGQVDVNAEDGIVVLRGEVERPELIEELVEKARKVQGVRDVQNLLHTPGTPAPTNE